jgi:hypothetical protein
MLPTSILQIHVPSGLSFTLRNAGSTTKGILKFLYKKYSTISVLNAASVPQIFVTNPSKLTDAKFLLYDHRNFDSVNLP